MEIVPGLWQFSAVHPEWEEGDDWAAEVAWWAVRTGAGVVLIDPLVEDWSPLDRLVGELGGCAAIARTCWWHERSIEAARDRYTTEVWAREPSEDAPPRALDRPLHDGDRLPGGLEVFTVVRDDELALWLPEHRTLVFGDVMVRSDDGTLSMCPESWVDRAGGHPALRSALDPLGALDPEHVLVSHGPLVLGDAASALPLALAG